MPKLVGLEVKARGYVDGARRITITSSDYGVKLTLEAKNLDDPSKLEEQAEFLAGLIRDFPSLMESILDRISEDTE